MAIYNNDELIKYYEDAALKNKNDITSLYGQQAQTLGASRYNIADAYAKARTDAYATSRISALGNNEQLAAQGLAGNAYAKPTSGYSETSRIYQDVNLQNKLNALGESGRSALQELQAAIRSSQQNKISALNQNQSYYDNQIMSARQNAYDTNFQLDQQNANYLAQMAGQGVQLDEQQQALLGRYGYNYGQINQLYQDEYSKLQKQQQDQINAGYVDTYREMLEKGQPLTPEQKAIFDKYSGVTTEQYKSYLDGVKQQQVEAEQNYNASTIEAGILDGSMIYGDTQISAQSLQEMKDNGIINEKIYNMLLPKYQAAKAGTYEQRINEIANAISLSNGVIDPINAAALAQIAQEVESGKGKDITESDYNTIKRGIDALSNQYNIPTNPNVGMAKFTNENDINWSYARNKRNVVVSVGGNSYEVEISNKNVTEEEKTKTVNAGLKANGQVLAMDGKVYMLITSGNFQKVVRLEQAEKKGIKDNYDKLLTALSQST